MNTLEVAQPEQVDALLDETVRLRVLLQEIIETYSVRVDDALGAAQARLEAAQAGEPLPQHDVAAMLARVRATAFKPEKGRAKDLVQLRRVAKALAKTL